MGKITTTLLHKAAEHKPCTTSETQWSLHHLYMYHGSSLIHGSGNLLLYSQNKESIYKAKQYYQQTNLKQSLRFPSVNTRLSVPLLGTDNVPHNVLVNGHPYTRIATRKCQLLKECKKKKRVSGAYAPEEEPGREKHTVRLHSYHRTAGTDAFKGC